MTQQSATLLILHDQDHRLPALAWCNTQQQLSNLPQLGEHDPALTWVNLPEEALSIEHVRTLQTSLAYARQSTPQYYILQHMEQASIPAQNALLKLLEEPPSHAVLLLTATDEQRVLDTIASRCRLEIISSERTLRTATDTLDTLIRLISSGTYAEIIVFSEQYKKREEAEQLLTDALVYIHQKGLPTNLSLSQQRWSKIQWQRLLLQGVEALQRNGNARLVIEHHLFLCRQQSITSSASEI